MGSKPYSYSIDEKLQKKFEKILEKDIRERSTLIRAFIQCFVKDHKKTITWLKNNKE